MAVKDALNELTQALSYYRQELKKSPEAIQYLKSRGLTAQTVNEFKLGFAPSDPVCFQLFRNRIMFPMQDTHGDYVAFVGRTIVNEDPKYRNSWESAEYQKGRILYGFAAAFPQIVQTETVILVEGQFDLLQLWQAGVRNVVAGSGTGFTPIHGRLLSRYAAKVCLAFDGDGAGERAVLRTQKFLEDVGVQVIKGSLPTGYDPDSFVCEFGASKFMELFN